MGWWLYITPFFAAALGWLLAAAAIRILFRPYSPKKIAGFHLQGLLPAKQQELAAKAGALSASFFSIKEIEEKITHPDSVKKIMPQAEEQIDHFLRVKLVKSMPVVGMFVGDKTINTLKAVFMTELEQLFPEIMKNYMGRLQEDLNIEQLVAARIAAITPAAIETGLRGLLKKELQLTKLLGALMGFIIAAVQLALLLLLR